MPKESNLQAEEFGNFPLLASIALDLLGKELETRVHKFTRYADDIFLIVKSAKEPQRVWRTTSGFAERPASK